MDILRNPTTVKLLAKELIKACDAYISMVITEKHFKELILHYATYHGTKLFSINGFNPTITNRLGKKRIELISYMLKGYQQKLI